GDDGAERDGHERGRHDRDAGEEPRLADELAPLERPARQREGDVDGGAEEVAGGAQRRGGGPAHDGPPPVWCAVTGGKVGVVDWNEPGGGVTPCSAHHWPGGRWLGRGSPFEGWSCKGIGGSGGSSALEAASAASSSASFSSAIPIGPIRCAARNCRTTGSSEHRHISRGPNIARCWW